MFLQPSSFSRKVTCLTFCFLVLCIPTGSRYNYSFQGAAGSSSGSEDNGSSSGSGSGSESSGSSSLGGDQVPVSRKPGGSSKPDWQADPELYGIRQSGRSKKEPERYIPASSDSDEGSKKKRRYPFQGTYVPKLTLGPFLTLIVRNGHKLKDWVFGITAHI